MPGLLIRRCSSISGEACRLRKNHGFNERLLMTDFRLSQGKESAFAEDRFVNKQTLTAQGA